MMRKLPSYLFIALFAALLVWLIANDRHIILGILGFVCMSLIIGGIGFMYVYLQGAWNDFFYRQRLQELLGNMTLEEVLEKSPYEYGHFQGEDGYRIWLKDTLDGFVGFGMSERAVHMWIVEQYLK